MPQPALHLLVADRALRHWHDAPTGAPFDCADPMLANAFRHGALAPDYGLFPGGDREFSALAHRGPTGALLRAVLAAARTPAQQAFAWGWLTHTLADIAIHPLVNRAAAQRAGAGWMLADHVRVEVGLDVWFTHDDVDLRHLRLTPAFDAEGYSFVANAARAVGACDVGTARLVAMQRGMIRFTHAALHFATSLARHVCWDDERGLAWRRHPFTTSLWNVASRLSPRASLVRAYLQPVRPDADLAGRVERALSDLLPDVDRHVRSRLRDLPDYDLETGALQAPRGPLAA